MAKKILSKKPRFFYGYWILFATFMLTFIHAGCGFFTFSLFVKPLQADLGWSRGSVMAAFTIFYLLIAVSSPFVGRLVDRYGVKRVIINGALIAGAGFVLLSSMDELWQFYVGYALVGVGLSAEGYIPASAVISNWFKKRRGLSVGIMSTGIGVGGMALAPLIGGYVIPNFGWSMAFLSLAIITCGVVIPLALFVIRTKPSEMGLKPDGAEAPDVDAVSEASLPVAGGLTLKMALATSTFWLIFVSFLSSSFGQGGIVQNQAPHLEDIGFPSVLAATALGGVGLGSAVGKLFFGWLCDRIRVKYACLIGFCFQLGAVVTIMNVKAASPVAVIWLYAILMGLGAGSWLPTMSMLTSTNFGLAAYGAIFGTISSAQAVGVATGPLLAGYLYDAMNNYHLPFVIFLVLYAIAIPTILAVRRPKSL